MRVFLIVILLTWCTSANAQQPFVRDLWYNDASLPVKTNAILQDNNGYIWLGTDDGLYRFNGRSFALIKDDVHRPVTALTLSGNRVYAGYKNGSIGIVEGDEVRPMKVMGVVPATA
ncbi:MAG: two-component regulator propeller domain-containing protein, partial [Flavipsychrobacter sp.]